MSECIHVRYEKQYCGPDKVTGFFDGLGTDDEPLEGCTKYIRADVHEAALARKDERIKKLEAAVKFYAYGNYDRKKWDFDCGLEEPSEIEEDGGAIARAALEADE